MQLLLLSNPLCSCTQPFFFLAWCYGQPCRAFPGTNMAAMLSRSSVRVFASAAKDNKPRASASRVVPKASLNDAPKQYIETGAEAPMPTGSLPSMATTPFDNYQFAPIREATVSATVLVVSWWSLFAL